MISPVEWLSVIARVECFRNGGNNDARPAHRWPRAAIFLSPTHIRVISKIRLICRSFDLDAQPHACTSAAPPPGSSNFSVSPLSSWKLSVFPLISTKTLFSYIRGAATGPRGTFGRSFASTRFTDTREAPAIPWISIQRFNRHSTAIRCASIIVAPAVSDTGSGLARSLCGSNDHH